MSVIFSPRGATVRIEGAIASSESVALTAFSGNAGGVVRVVNATNVRVFVEFGTSAVAATTTASMPIESGQELFVELGPAITHAAAIENATATGNVYFTSGQAR